MPSIHDYNKATAASSVEPEDYNFDSAKQDQELLGAIKRYARNIEHKVFSSDDEALDWWKGDRRWKDANTVSILKELNTVNQGTGKPAWGGNKVSQEDLKDLSVIRDRWDRIPGALNPFNNRNTGVMERIGAVAENVGKGILDPTIVAGGVAGKAAGAAANAGLKAAGKEALGQTAKATLKAGAGIAADAGVAANANVAIQEADVGLGRREEVDTWEAIKAGTLGAALSSPGHIGGAMQGTPKQLDITKAKEQALQGSEDLKAKGVTELFTQKERAKFTGQKETDLTKPIYARHGVSGYQEHELGGWKGFMKPNEVNPDIRYDGGGGAYGNYTYFDETQDWNDGSMGRGIDNRGGVYKVKLEFKKPFLLTPDNIQEARRVIGLTEDDPAMSGVMLAERLDKLGYDGLVVRGFTDFRNKLDSEATHFRTNSFGEESKAIQRGKYPKADKARDDELNALIAEGKDWNKEDLGKNLEPWQIFDHEIHSRGLKTDAAQDQIVSLKPHENASIVPHSEGKLDPTVTPTVAPFTPEHTLSSQFGIKGPKLIPTTKRITDYVTGKLIGINAPEGEDALIGGVDAIIKDANVGKTTIKDIEKAAQKGQANSPMEAGEAMLNTPHQAASSTDLATIDLTRNALQRTVMDPNLDPDVRFKAYEVSSNLLAKKTAMLGESARGMAYQRWRPYTDLGAKGFFDKVDKAAKGIKKVTGQELGQIETKEGRKKFVDDVTMAYNDLMQPGPDGTVNTLAIDLFHANLENQKLGKGDMFWEAWYNSLLSGPQTQVVNVTGNAFTTAMQASEYVAAHSAAGVKPTYIMAAYVKAIPDAIKVFKRTFSTEVPNDPLTRMELKESQAIPSMVFGPDVDALSRWRGDKLKYERALDSALDDTFPSSDPVSISPKHPGDINQLPKKFRQAGIGEKGWGGRQVRLPGRFLMAMDDAFKTIHYRAGITDAAIREVLAEAPTLKGKDFENAVNAKIALPSEQMDTYGRDISRVLTFTRPLGDIGQGVQKLVDSIPGGRLVVPFVRTPGDLIKYAADMVSVPGTIMSTKRTADDFAAGGIRRRQAMARLTMGWGIMSMGAWGAMTGNVNGGGPTDPAEKAAWQTNNLPWSIKMGNQQVQWSRLDPVAMPFALGAGAVDIAKAMNDPTREGAMWSTTAKLFADAVLDKSWFQGVQNVMNAVTDPAQSADTFTNGLVRSFVPSMVASVGRAYDPRVTAPQTFIEVVQDRLAFDAREKVPSKIDVLGREVPVAVVGAPEGSTGPVAFAARLTMPFKTKPVDDDPVAKEIANLRIAIKPPTEKWNGVNLDSKQLYVYSKARGQYIYNGIKYLQQSEGWENMHPGVKRMIIDKLKTEATKVADVTLYGVYPDIIQERYRDTNDPKLKKFTQPTREEQDKSLHTPNNNPLLQGNTDKQLTPAGSTSAGISDYFKGPQTERFQSSFGEFAKETKPIPATTVLDKIAVNSKDDSAKRLALQLSTVMKSQPEVPVKTVQVKSGRLNAAGLTESEGDSKITLFVPSDPKRWPEADGRNEETMLHEGVHAVVRNYINNTDNNIDKDLPEFYNLWNDFTTNVDKDKFRAAVTRGKEGPDLHIGTAEAIGGLHEFIAWGLTNPEVQKELKSMAYNGKYVTKEQRIFANDKAIREADAELSTKGSMWNRFVQAVGGLLNDNADPNLPPPIQEPKDLTYLDALLSAKDDTFWRARNTVYKKK